METIESYRIIGLNCKIQNLHACNKSDRISMICRDIELESFTGQAQILISSSETFIGQFQIHLNPFFGK